jgi:predicted RNase H-like HicB family nuclease
VAERANILRRPHRTEARVDIAITTERAEDKGWIAFAPEVRATAQGSTEDEAKANLRALLEKYPDLLDEPRGAADRRVELIRL